MTLSCGSQYALELIFTSQRKVIVLCIPTQEI